MKSEITPRRPAPRSAAIDSYSKRFQELKAELGKIEYFSKGTVLARMVRKASVRLPYQTLKTSRSLLRMDLQSPRQDGQRAAQRRSRAPFPGCRQAIPQTQIALDPPGEALTSRALEIGERRHPPPSPLTKTPRYLHIPAFSLNP